VASAAHLGSRAVPRIHRQKGDPGEFGAHRIGVVGGNAGRTELLQQHGLQVDEMKQRPGHVEDRVARADPDALGMIELDLETGTARSGFRLEKIEGETRRTDHRPPHEHGIGRRPVAKPADDGLGLQKIAVRTCRERPVRHRFASRDRGEPACAVTAIALTSML